MTDGSLDGGRKHSRVAGRLRRDCDCAACHASQSVSAPILNTIDKAPYSLWLLKQGGTPVERTTDDSFAEHFTVGFFQRPKLEEEWMAPIRATASMAAIASGIIGR